MHKAMLYGIIEEPSGFRLIQGRLYSGAQSGKTVVFWYDKVGGIVLGKCESGATGPTLKAALSARGHLIASELAAANAIQKKAMDKAVAFLAFDRAISISQPQP